MAYTKTVWEDLPSEDTPILSTALQNIEDGIEALDTDKAPKASPTFTGTVTLPSSTSIGDVSSTELGYIDGVTSAIQTQLNSKISGWVGVDITGNETSGTHTTKIGGSDINLFTYALVTFHFRAIGNNAHRIPITVRMNGGNNYLITQYNNVTHNVGVIAVTSGSFSLTITPASGSNLIRLVGIEVLV